MNRFVSIRRAFTPRSLAVSSIALVTLAGVSQFGASKIPTKTLPATPHSPVGQIPVVAYGTGTEWYAPKEEQKAQLIKAIEQALQNGYYQLDCAQMYQNEQEVGIGIKNSGIQREKLFITSKVGQTHRRPDDIRIAVNDTLKKLGVKYLDLYLIHSPFDSPVPLKESWKAMEGLVKDGLVRQIGVSNFQVEHLQEILPEAKIAPSVNQIEFHPQLSQPELSKFCKEKKITIASYAPLIAFYKKPPGSDKVIGYAESLGKKYGKSAAQVLLRWNLQHGNLLVTTTSNPKRLQENQAIFDFELTQKEVEEIDKIGAAAPYRQYWQPYFPAKKAKL